MSTRRTYESAKRTGEVVEPDSPAPNYPPGTSSTRIAPQPGSESEAEAAAVLVAHLFAQSDRDIPGISYAVSYRLAEAHSGGDIVDIYRFDNDSVAMAIADISGKGAEAAVHAALIKYGLRAYCSHGLTPERAMRAMDRLYLENSTFEQEESFASAFLGIIDPHRRTLTYSCAGHEPVLILHPGDKPQLLAPTAPIIGVFEDQHHLFRQEITELSSGSLLVAATDGITEARRPRGGLYGAERLMDCVARNRDAEPSQIVDAIIEESHAFASGTRHDDVAVLVARMA